MIKFVNTTKSIPTENYEMYALLALTVQNFRLEAEKNLKCLRNRTLWHVSSTSQGGGVAEMLQNIIGLLIEFNVDSKWVVLQTDQKVFFNLTKRIHNFIHGKQGPSISELERDVYDEVNRMNAESLEPHIKDGDVIVIHDPQPMGMAEYIKKHKDVKIIWRCHIGLNETNTATKKAWDFLCRFFRFYDHFVFTDPDYVPKAIKDNFSIIPPGIDPLSHKNRHLSLNKISGILRNAEIVNSEQPNISDPFTARARRVLPDGSLGSPLLPKEHGLMFRPLVTQVSRWDRLKGFVPLMKAFAHLKQNQDNYQSTKMHVRRLKNVRLILAGPDPDYVTDDPEGEEVLKELMTFYRSLPKVVAEDIALLMLPMKSIKENALIVNALQRCSSIVVQNSLQEGFGLTATEAMYKQIPVMGTRACGLSQQIRPDIDGCLVEDPENHFEVAEVLNYMLKSPKKREVWASNAQKRVMDEYLVFSQITRWMMVFNKVV